MLSVLTTGTLIADAVKRTASNGWPYVTAMMRCACLDADPVLVSLIAFDAEAVTLILALSRGDSLSVAGRAKLTSWTKDGEERHGLSITVDRAMTSYQAGKARKAAQAEAA